MLWYLVVLHVVCDYMLCASCVSLCCGVKGGGGGEGGGEGRKEGAVRHLKQGPNL